MSGVFDVFLSYNSQDLPIVRKLAQRLREMGISVWLDNEQLIPGRLSQNALEEAIKTTRTAAVLIGKNGLGPWQNTEMRTFVSLAVTRGMPVIPVLLPDAPVLSQLSVFLQQFTWVDLRDGLTNEGMERLRRGINGDSGESGHATPRTRDPVSSRFIPDAFEYIAKFFRDSISELGTRNRKIEIRFSRVNSRSFEVAVKGVRDDEKPIDICYRIWTTGTEIMMGEKPTRALEMTVSLAVARAPYSSVPAAKDILLAKWRLSADRNRDGLHLSAHARGWLGFRNERQQLSMHGGAEYLWQVFTKLVQNPKSV